MTEHILYCANHPTRDTNLRCNRCGTPICATCAVQTPVGYRCRACLRGQQKVFETARNIDLPIAFILSALGMGLGTYVLNYLSFWGLFVAPIVGGGIAEVVRWAVRRRRSLHLPLLAAIGGGAGVAFYILAQVIQNLRSYFLTGVPLDLSTLSSVAFFFIWPVLYGALMISALYARLRGIRL